MLFIETNVGNFGKFKDILLYMQDEKIDIIHIINVEYCLSKIFGSGIYTINQIEKIVKEL